MIKNENAKAPKVLKHSNEHFHYATNGGNVGEHFHGSNGIICCSSTYAGRGWLISHIILIFFS